MSKPTNLVTPKIIAEWNEIRRDKRKLSQWQNDCRQKEPALFFDYWEQYTRLISMAILHELPKGMMAAGLIRSIEQINETVLLAGYFFGRRQFESGLDSLNRSLAADVEVSEEDEREPPTGGFPPNDFVL